MAENKSISVAIIAASVGKTPKDIPYAFVFEEAYRLAQRINVHIIRSKFEGDDYSYGINFHGIKKKIDFRALEYTMRNLSVYPSISLLRNPVLIYWENLYAINVFKVVEDNDIDIIHAHFAYPEGFIGLLAKRKTKKPLIITCHGYDINIVPEINYGIRLNKKYDSLIRLALKNADAIVCVSNDMRDKVLRLGVNKERTFVVFNGVDIKLFRPPAKNEVDTLNKVRKFFGIYEDDFVILNARHLRPVYGIEYIIHAAKIVTEKVKKVKFIIAGEGELKEKLAAMIRNMNLERNVRLIGAAPKSLMSRLMQISSLYVNTSLADGMSPSMLEACASGLPIVSFNVGGASDIIENGVNGFLVPVKNWKELATKIIYLLQNTRVLKNMSKMARKIAQEKFDINKRIDAIISIYENLNEA